MTGYSSFDALVLDIAVNIRYGGDAFPMPEGLTETEKEALDAFAEALAAGKDPEGEVYETAHISYTHAGTMWKRLIKEEEHALIDRAADRTASVLAEASARAGIDTQTACERYDRFYEDLFKRKEDSISRNFDDADFIAMDLGLDPWYVLDDETKKSYASSRMKDGAIQSDMLKRHVPATASALKKILLSYPGMNDNIWDMYLTELIYDALRTARTGEEAKAEAFAFLASLSGAQYVRNAKTWYEIRDNRSNFAADAFLLIHDGNDEDRLFRDLIAEDLKREGKLTGAKEFILITEKLLSLFEAYTLSEEGHLPGGFSAKEYMKKLAERLIKTI